MSEVALETDKPRVSVIGLRGHAGRHIRMLRQNPDVILDRVYYHRTPPSEYSSLPVTQDLTDCLDSNVVIISSPTPVHAEQIQALRNYGGYIFLEKPAASNKDEIDSLLHLPSDLKSRIRVNFNFLWHDLAARMRELASSPMLGKVFALDVHLSHGGAFRDDWDDSWRLNNSSFGPLETVGIHFIHFAITQFSQCRKAVVRTSSVSSRSQAVDTGMISMQMDNGVWVNILNSYAAPYTVRVELWGTNGYAIYDGTGITLRSPRDTFDERGRYTTPPSAGYWPIDYATAWEESLNRSLRNFLDVSRQGIRLDPAAFDRDVSTMNVLLDAERLS